MSEPQKYPTILPETDHTEIGPLEEDAPPMDPAFLEWWNNRCRTDQLDQDATLSIAVRPIAYFAWCARDAKIARLEADPEHFRNRYASSRDRVNRALDVARIWITRNTKHKSWVIDQMVRTLTGEKYEEFIAWVKSGDQGPETYTWDCGVEP